MTIEQEEIKKVNDYIDNIKSMNKNELVNELKLYIGLIEKLEGQYILHKGMLVALKTYIEHKILSRDFEKYIDYYYEEAIYERSYLYNLKYISKKMKKNITNDDLYNIYLSLVNLNYTNECRFKFISSMYNYVYSKGMIDNMFLYDNKEMLDEVGTSINKMFKKVKRR